MSPDLDDPTSDPSTAPDLCAEPSDQQCSDPFLTRSSRSSELSAMNDLVSLFPQLRSQLFQLAAPMHVEETPRPMRPSCIVTESLMPAPGVALVGSVWSAS
jgi:hypothetical protein